MLGDDSRAHTGHRQRSRTWATSVTVLVLLLGAGAGAMWLLGTRNGTAPNGPARQAAVDFLTDLQWSRYSAAYGLLCPQDSSGMQPFVRYWQQQGTSGQAIAEFTITHLTATEEHGTGSGQASVDVRYSSGSTQAMPLPLTELNHRWYACPTST